MGLNDDLMQEVKAIFKAAWDEEKTENVPNPEDLRLNSNHAKNIESATVLYADLDGSTQMVDKFKWPFAAEIYKGYLRCAAQIIRAQGGAITAYDGDRIMAIYTGDTKNTSAVKTAMKINFAVEHILKPALKEQYPTTDFTLKHVVGIDTSELRAARIGVRVDNDLVWVGRAANYAAKLTTLSEKPIWITKKVYDSMNDEVKILNGINMWERRYWKAMNELEIYCSAYWWRIG